jgi:ABC-type antimicrobial peptide transport system permease subunit
MRFRDFRFAARMVTAFLATLGIYGVTAYAVQQGSKEMAIRVALGAPPRGVVGMLLRESTVVLGLGTVAGLLGSVSVSRLLRDQVFGVQSVDPLTYLVACTLLLGAGLTAALWAARAAALADARKPHLTLAESSTAGSG